MMMRPIEFARADDELLRIVEDFLEFAERENREHPTHSHGRKQYVAAIKYYWLGVCDTYRRVDARWVECILMPIVEDLSGLYAIWRALDFVEDCRARRVRQIDEALD